MESIIDQKQLDKVVELNKEYVKANESMQKMIELTKALTAGESKINWNEKYLKAFELLTEKENIVKRQMSIINQLIEQNKGRETEIDRKTIIIQAYKIDNEVLRKRLKNKYWKLFERIAPYFILLIFALGLMFHLI